MNTMLATAFVLGVAGSAHCVGMCGPIALAVPVPRKTWSSCLVGALLLNTGRLSSYAVLGAAVGVFGTGMRLAGLQQMVSIGAGLLLLATVVIPGLLERWSPSSWLTIRISRLRHVLARNLARTAPEALFFTGVLNGLLPCGLLYAALIGASAMASPIEGAGFMALFALGTWPAIIFVRMSGGMLGPSLRIRLRRLSPMLVSVVAVLMILRGMELGIPYVSPAAAIAPVNVTACH